MADDAEDQTALEDESDGSAEEPVNETPEEPVNEVADETEDEMAKAMAEAMAAENQDNGNASKNDTVEDPGPPATPLATLDEQRTGPPLGQLDFILDVPLQITVTLGHTKLLIKELLQLGQGSVVELEKMAGEPMDVLIGDKLIARGEVVVVNEKFGVRLTDIVSTVDRIENLS